MIKYRNSKIKFDTLSSASLTLFYILNKDGCKELIPMSEELTEISLKQGTIIVMKTVVFKRGRKIKEAVIHLCIDKSQPIMKLYGFNNSGYIEGKFMILSKDATHSIEIEKGNKKVKKVRNIIRR